MIAYPTRLEVKPRSLVGRASGGPVLSEIRLLKGAHPAAGGRHG